MSLHIFAIVFKTIIKMTKKKTSKIPKSNEGLDELFDLSFLMPINVKKGALRTPLNVKKATDKLQALARKSRSILKELQDAKINLEQEWIIAEPTVYVARTTDKKYDNEYFTAKTTWPTLDGKKREIKIYLGKAEDFGNDTMSVKAREYAKDKMSDTLRRRKDLGEI